MELKQADLKGPYPPCHPFKGYFSLFLGLLIFSGLFTGVKGPLGSLDFVTLLGEFGLSDGSRISFQGVGASGAKQGFMFALEVFPAVVLALGLVSIIEGQGGLWAAEKLLSPILKFILGIPGLCGLAIITSFQLTDVAAVQVRKLREQKLITANELVLITTYLFSAAHTVSMYFAVGLILFPYYPPQMPLSLPLLVVFLSKIIGTNLMRLYLQLESRICATK